MGRFLAGEDEELLRSFRPHPFSWLPSYSAAFLWALWGALAWWTRQATGSQGAWIGYATLATLGVAHGYVRLRVRKDARVVAIHGAALATVLLAAIAELAGMSDLGPFQPYAPLAVGVLLTAFGLVAREMNRLGSSSYITTLRTVTRRGLAPRREFVLLHKDVQAVETLQGVLGGLFGFGRIRLVRGRRKTKKKTKKAEVETEEDDVLELRGVPRFEEARRDLNSLVHEVRLSARERGKRLEERRLRDSMVELSRWKPRGPD